MPKFIANGPDIPEQLIWAHEEGKVVFFCGAGISDPAGLPDFKGLVDQLYLEIGDKPRPDEYQAYKNRQYDATLDLLERRYPGQRVAVRKTIAKILTPQRLTKASTATHKSLLQLATDRQGRVRLVTTNFDRIFQRVMRGRQIPEFAAPLLPIPKPTRWHGIVHLHGLLPRIIDPIALNRLVLTSGDFGLAYLTERWAARFVSELFRNFIVCFIGYSINDPVLRYMMDALAVDEMLGERRQDAYAFGAFEPGKRDDAMLEWQAKGVTPLLYEVPRTRDHSALHSTLNEWAATYRDGVRGKEMIIAQHATTPPLTSSRFDFAVGRVLWALTDDLPAKHFANLNPVPPLEWLKPLVDDQFKHDDLRRFRVAPKTERDDELAFSVLRRPPPYNLAPRMCLVNYGSFETEWDQVMRYLAQWLMRHLNDPFLVFFLAEQGGQLHDTFATMLRSKLKELDTLAKDKNAIASILTAAPNAIPDRAMRVIWNLFLSGRVKRHVRASNLHDWVRRFKRDGLTPTLRLELRDMLSPSVAIREPFRYSEK